MTLTIGIVFGGSSPEHNETVRAARTLYRLAIRGELDQKYRFKYFYLSEKNLWASSKSSMKVLRKEEANEFQNHRIVELQNVDVIYSTLMGSCGENGNIMGLANLYRIPIIGCDILASALALDKHLSKIVAKSIGVPIVDGLHVYKDEDPQEIIRQIEFPCFVKPTNLGTCAYVFRADTQEEFLEKWNRVIKRNKYGDDYLIEKFIQNIEVRVFVHQDLYGNLKFNDEYNTVLIESALKEGGGLFDHVKNKFSKTVRNEIREYAEKIFKTFKMKDYARIDFFVENNTSIYFNEANTQPFISKYNVELMERDGYTYGEFIDTMVQRNVR